MNGKRNFYIILSIGFVIRLAFVLNGHYISPDGTHYASLGYHLLHDFRFVSDGAQFPDIIQPPLYPFFLGIATLILKAEYAGKFISLIFGLGLIWAVFRFMDRLTHNAKLAEATALFVAVDPGLVAVSSQVASESLYLFLLFALYATLFFYLQHKRLGQIIAAATLTGMLYLTRPEGLLYFAVGLFILFLWRKPWWHSLLYFLLFSVFVVLYSSAVYQRLGYWTVSPKLSFILAQGKVSRYYLQGDRQLGRKINPKMQWQRLSAGLGPDKKELAAIELFRKEKAALDFFRTKGQNKEKWLGRFVRRVLANEILAAKKFVNGWAFPWGYWIFLLFGLWRFPLKKWKGAMAYSAIFLLPVSVVLAVNVEQRFLYSIPMIVAPLLGRGLVRLAQVLKRAKPMPIWAGLTLFVLISAFPGYAQIWQKTRAKNYYFSVGHWLQKEVPDKKRIAARVPQAVFFAGKPYSPLPFAPLDSLELYLRRKQVSFILLEDKDRHLRPGLLETNRLPPFLEPEKTLHLKHKTFLLLRVKIGEKR